LVQNRVEKSFVWGSDHVHFVSSVKLGGQPLDIFIVNSFSSFFQATFVLLLLPVLSGLRGVSFHELPGYLAEGAE
jgi:hypothetical protein